jgi:hypothetical protein
VERKKAYFPDPADQSAIALTLRTGSGRFGKQPAWWIVSPPGGALVRKTPNHRSLQAVNVQTCSGNQACIHESFMNSGAEVMNSGVFRRIDLCPVFIPFTEALSPFITPPLYWGRGIVTKGVMVWEKACSDESNEQRIKSFCRCVG